MVFKVIAKVWKIDLLSIRLVEDLRYSANGSPESTSCRTEFMSDELNAPAELMNRCYICCRDLSRVVTQLLFALSG